MITWSESTRPCPIITWDGLVIIGEHLHVDRIFYTTHARPFGLLCSEAMSVHMLGSSSQPKCFACVPRPCPYMLGSSTPVVFEHKNLSHPIITWCFETTNFRNGAHLGGTLSWYYYEGASYFCRRPSGLRKTILLYNSLADRTKWAPLRRFVVSKHHVLLGCDRV